MKTNFLLSYGILKIKYVFKSNLCCWLDKVQATHTEVQKDQLQLVPLVAEPEFTRSVNKEGFFFNLTYLPTREKSFDGRLLFQRAASVSTISSHISNEARIQHKK